MNQAIALESQTIAGWGMAVGGASQVVAPTSKEGLAAALAYAADHGLRVALRGSGCSYGDAACGTGKLVIDLAQFHQILDFSPQTGILRGEAGVTLRQVWQTAVAAGFWPPVVSGTMAPTLGGAASMNIHGKNAYAVGPIGEHIQALEVMTPGGQLLEVSRQQRPDLFHAIIGGAGELGLITRVDLKLKPIYSGKLNVHATSAPNFGALLDRFVQALPSSDYAVAWLDAFATGRALGRGLIHTARQLAQGEDPDAKNTLQVQQQELPLHLMGVFPKAAMWRLMKPFAHPAGMRLINWAKYQSGRWLEDGKDYQQSHGAFHFLLDYVPNWKWIYRPHGLVQHQSFVPDDRVREVFPAILALCHKHGMPSWLAVLKRHRPDPFLLSHGLDGWSLAQDFPVTPRNREALWEMCHQMDELVMNAGGKVYFAKDATVRPASVLQAFGAEKLLQFKALRDELDPNGLLATDLYDRALAPAIALAQAADCQAK